MIVKDIRQVDVSHDARLGDLMILISYANKKGLKSLNFTLPGPRADVIEALQDSGYVVSISLNIRDQLTIYWK